jgi:hypothetical protein
VQFDDDMRDLLAHTIDEVRRAVAQVEESLSR